MLNVAGHGNGGIVHKYAFNWYFPFRKTTIKLVTVLFLQKK